MNRCSLLQHNNKEKEWLDRKKIYDTSKLDARNQGTSREISEAVKRFMNKKYKEE